jgi:pyruvyltransferase
MFIFIKNILKGVIDRYFFIRNIRLPIRKNRVNIFYWRPANIFQDNVGDYLSKIVINYMIDYYGCDKKKKVKQTKVLMGIGSCFKFAKQNYTTWGSGSQEESYLKNICGIELDIRCVRGPKTINVLKTNGLNIDNISIGDPALLLPLFYMPKNIPKKYSYGVIPYFRRVKNYKGKYPKVITTLTKDWKNFIREILECEFVVSASLHGIIIAEAYGIPAIMLNDHLEKSNFKYDDYYQSTGRMKYKIADTVEKAVQMGPEKLPDLKKLQENLLISFPYDLWR